MSFKWPLFWRIVKLGLAIAIVGGVAWHFFKLLNRPELTEKRFELNPFWILASAILYAAGFAIWGGYWLRLLRQLGESLTVSHAARAYFVSQLGKYVPGKAVAIVMRVAMAKAAGVRASVAAISATYETLTTMASGAIVAATLIAFVGSSQSDLGWKALGLLAIAGIPILPGVFNRLANRLARPFLPANAPPLPKLHLSTLILGLLQTSLGWFCLGLSLLALLQSFEFAGELPVLASIAYVSLAYVAGFLTLPAPGGLGVREAILQQLLASHFAAEMGREPAESSAVVVVLLLRLVWTVTELTLAGAAALLPRPTPRSIDS